MRLGEREKEAKREGGVERRKRYGGKKKDRKKKRKKEREENRKKSQLDDRGQRISFPSKRETGDGGDRGEGGGQEGGGGSRVNRTRRDYSRDRKVSRP